MWITSLLLNIVTISLNSNVLPSNKSICPLPRKILLTVLWVTSLQQFFLPRHLDNVSLLNPLSWDRRDNNLKWDTFCQSIMSSFCMTMLDHTQSSGLGRQSSIRMNNFITPSILTRMNLIHHHHHHHHHVVPSTRISLTLSRHPSLSSIASGRSDAYQEEMISLRHNLLKTIVRKPLMIKIIKLRLRNLDN